MTALAFMAGVGPRWLAARWPDDREILRQTIDAVHRARKRERQDLANMIAKGIGG